MLKMISLRSGRIKAKNILTFALIFSLFYRSLVDYLHVFSACRYIIDFCLILMIGLTFTYKKRMSRSQKLVLRFTVIYYLYCFVTYFFHFQSFVYLAYGTIYRFRYYAFAILCLVWYKKTDIEKINKCISILFYINALITLFQYFILGVYGDYLGGLFGNTQGCNAYSNLFLIVTITLSGVNFLEKREKPAEFVSKLLICFVIAAIAELKFFFIEFIVLIAFAIFFTGFSWKKVFLAMGAIVALIGGFVVFANTYSYGKDFLNLDVWIKLATSGGYSAGYGGTGEVNRLTFASVILQRFLSTPLKRLFGLGLGNCSYSSITLFNTPFYEANYLTRYEWFTSSHTLLEQGWIGFAFYVGFFVLVFVKAYKQLRKKESDKASCYIAEIMSVMGVILMIYNNSLTMESGFLFYFVLMMPFVKQSGISSRGNM